MTVNNFSEFCEAILDCGFSMGGGNSKGIYAVIPFGWDEQDFIDSPIKWHTGNPDTDPWEWRMRVLEERSDIAYSKLFFRTSGYIAKQWYPDFLAVRRGGETMSEAYSHGSVSHTAKRIYDIVSENGETAFHDIKRFGCFGKENNAEFERAIVELQMQMFITMCGRAQKKNKYGAGYGWSSTVFTTVEDFWKKRQFEIEEPNPEDAYKKIRDRILTLNPDADDRKIKKFIMG